MSSNSKLLIVFALLVCFAAVSCSKSVSNETSGEKKVFNSTGVIKAIDLNALKITIDHQDIPGYMATMEMSFTLANAAVADGIAVGDKVAFVLERADGKVKLTRMSKIVETAAANGAELFASNCAECHGAKGEGAKKGIPLISGHALAHTEEEYVQQVVNGKANKMPSFREKLNDEQVAAIVKYVRTVIQAAATDEQRTEHKH
jgi:mono/diheme cytochrome c family protein